MSASASAFLATDPSVLALQLLMISGAFLVVFLVLFTTRDVLLRTHSFFLQILCILLVAVLPIFGFFLYLLVRPPRTLSERMMDRKLSEILHRLSHHKKPQEKHSDKHQQKQKQK